jgi:coiled-coil domain-containing protein 12
VAKKLEKLEKRTQRAIAELIRKCSLSKLGPACWVVAQAQGASPTCLSVLAPGERLKGQEDSLASAVDATTEQEACDSD